VKEQVLTASTISLAVSVIGGWLWATSYFMTRADGDAVHDELVVDIKRSYLELKIDQATTEIVFLERNENMDAGQERQYELLKFSIERMTEQLMELGE